MLPACTTLTTKLVSLQYINGKLMVSRFITIRAVRVVLFSAVSVCLSVCLSVCQHVQGITKWRQTSSKMATWGWVGGDSTSLVLLTRDSMLSALYAIANPSVRLSVRLSVCPSHGWISRKRFNLGSCNFHHTVAPSLSCLRYKFHPEIPTWSPPPTERGRQTRVGCGNELIWCSNAFARWQHKLDFQSLLRNPTSELTARWRLCHALAPTSTRLSCFDISGHSFVSRLSVAEVWVSST